MVVFGNINLIKHLGSNCGSHSQAINGQVEWNNYPKLTPGGITKSWLRIFALFTFNIIGAKILSIPKSK